MMKKTLAILMLAILSLMVISGCQSKTAPATQTQTETTNGNSATQITNTADTTVPVDTTKVDQDLNGAGQTLNSW